MKPNDTETMDKLVKALGITIRSIRGRESIPDEFAGSSHWTVSLCRPTHLGARSLYLVTGFSLGSAHKGSPEPEDVLGSLASDSCCASDSFEDWCDSMGADTDSRNSLATYEACKAIRSRLRDWAGSHETFDRILRAEW